MSNPFSTIVVDVKKFFANTGSDVEKLAASFWKIFKKAPTALQTVDNFVTEAGGVVIAAVSLADPLVEPEAAVALATIETGLAAIDAKLRCGCSDSAHRDRRQESCACRDDQPPRNSGSGRVQGAYPRCRGVGSAD